MTSLLPFVNPGSRKRVETVPERAPHLSSPPPTNAPHTTHSLPLPSSAYPPQVEPPARGRLHAHERRSSAPPHPLAGEGDRQEPRLSPHPPRDISPGVRLEPCHAHAPGAHVLPQQEAVRRDQLRGFLL